jgi:hypothetical protein
MMQFDGKGKATNREKPPKKYLFNGLPFSMRHREMAAVSPYCETAIFTHEPGGPVGRLDRCRTFCSKIRSPEKIKKCA